MISTYLIGNVKLLMTFNWARR